MLSGGKINGLAHGHTSWQHAMSAEERKWLELQLDQVRAHAGAQVDRTGPLPLYSAMNRLDPA